MHRRLLPVLALLALALPLAAAQDAQQVLAPGTDLQLPIAAEAGSTLAINVTSDVPVDVLLIQGDAAAFYNGSQAPLRAVYNSTHAFIPYTLQGEANLSLLIDNSPQPSVGAAGDQNASVVAHVGVTPPETVVPTAPGTSGGSFWRTLMFTAHHWAVGPVGFGGVALWMAAFALAAAWGIETPMRKVATLALGAAGLTFLWALLPHPGTISQVGLPMLWGAGIGYVAVKGSKTLPEAVRFAALSSILGSFAGLAVGHYVHALWSGQSMLVLGGDRFTDALFLVPVMAVLTAIVVLMVPALVDALEDEEKDPVAPKPGQADVIHATCLRCGTAITVNRAWKRYRVATDRYEFPCPNCHAHMEWSEPKPPAAI